MEGMNLHLFVFSTVLATCCVASPDGINADLVNKLVQTTVDLTTHLPKITNLITIENTGKTAVKTYLFAVDPSISDNLSFIGALTKNGDEDQKLKVTETTMSKDGKFYRVDLPESLNAGGQTTVEVDTSYSHSLQPYPAQITQAEKQLVKFTGNSNFYSPYKSTSVSTTVNLASSNVESYTKTKPVVVSEGTITYGPYENISPFTEKEMVVHYENNNPFLTVTTMERVIEVSHWGNVAVEETVNIVHNGAALKGSFSRYDYQRNQDGVSSIKSFKTSLPAAAKDVYYRDEIGNISTSALRELDETVELELRPRFPLFGGWKTHYYIGYNVPSYQYLFNSGDQYLLKMRFVDHVYDDQVIDDLTVKVILPEGAKNVDLKTPFPVERDNDKLHYTYLDTMGRPVIILRKTNLVEQHAQDFELRYTFPKYLLLQEPLLVVGAFYLLFITVIIYVRLDFSITKDEASESRMRISGLIEQIQTIMDRRSALYQSYDDAINKFKTSKDSASFSGNRKKIDADYKQLTQQIAGLQTKLKAEGSDVAEKVAELQRLDSQVREQVTYAIQLAERLIAGKMNKQQYVEMESANKTKKEDICQKMDALLAAL